MPVNDAFEEMSDVVLEQVRDASIGDKDFFLMLCGHVFALHQDIMQSMAVDMRQFAPPTARSSSEQIQSRPAGDYSARYRDALLKLYDIEGENLDRGRSILTKDQNSVVEKGYCTLRLLAARIWTVTMRANAGGTPQTQTNVSQIWAALRAQDVSDFLEFAEDAVGTFMQGIKCERLRDDQWSKPEEMKQERTIYDIVFGSGGAFNKTNLAHINANFSDFRDSISDFKDNTKITWALIIPAVYQISARLFTLDHGLVETQRLFKQILQDIDDDNNAIRAGSILRVTPPPNMPAELAEVNSWLWKYANERIARGVSAGEVAQALLAFGLISAERVVEAYWATAQLKETYKALRSPGFG